MRILRAADHRRMPWKNGGGETVEVAVHPPGASTSGFDWRVSTAPFTADGGFSLFDGVDRTLAVLSGEGVALDIEGTGTVVLTPTSLPFRFAADVPTFGRLAGGAALNLNVMTRRAALTHRVEALGISGTAILADDARWTLVLPRGPVRLDGGEDEPAELGSGDAVLVEAGDGPVRLAAARSTLVYVVAVDPV